jgi:hypothetical protein
MKFSFKIIFTAALWFLFCATAFAQIGGTGWTPQKLNYKIQSPTNAPQSARYFVTNSFAAFGVTNWLFHCLVYSNDGAFSIGNTTRPRTEQRFNPDYTGGEIHYQAMFWCPSNENSFCPFQIHTGDAQSPTYGSTTFMAFWFTNSNGSLRDYSGTVLATNLGNRWFQINFDHNVVTRTIHFWIDKKLVWTQQDNGAGDFYIKDGVYEQDHNPTYQMDTYIITNSIMEWVSSGTNPPAAPLNLIATPTATKIPLTWDAMIDATNYNVKRSITSGGGYATIATVSGTAFTDSNAVSGTVYYYVVSALDQFGESSNSTQVAASLVNSGFQLVASPGVAAIAAGGSTNFIVTMTTNATFTGTTFFGVSGLPAGATASFSPTTLNHAGTSTLTISTTSNAPGGSYILTIQGTNAASTGITNVTLQLTGVAASAGTLLWTGSGDANWSTVPNWTNITAGGYGPPGISNNVVFTNAGASSIQGVVNNLVNSSTAILSLQYSHTNNFHTTQIAPGQTLTIATNLTAGTGTDLGANGTLSAAITGSGGSLIITNTNCIVTVRQGTAAGSAPWSQRATLDLSGLDNFSASLSRLLVAGDGSSAAFNSREVGTLLLAKTNYISAAGASPAIDVSDNNSNGAGSSADPAQLQSYLYLGLANQIFSDTITVGRSKTSGVMAFNPAFTNGSTPTVSLRGFSTSRVTTFSIGDDSPVGNSNQREAGAVDFSGGAVDALIGTAYIGRSMNGNNTGTAVSATGTLTFDTGTVNANILEIGYQTSAAGTGPGAVGTVNVNGAAALTVNQTLELAHGSVASPLEQGTLNLNGGTVLATNIFGGGGISTINLNSGILNLQSVGQITGVSTLNIGANGVDDPARLVNAANISAANAITIAPNGTLAGNTFVTSPSLTINGTISPGNAGVGAITNNGAAFLGAGGIFFVAVQNASGSPATGWDFLKVNGALNVQSFGGSPFVIQVESFDPNGSGLVTNFNSGSNYVWTIAMAAGGIANFSPDEFAVDTSTFANSLAGGNFSVTTNGNFLQLVFTPRPPPLAFGSIGFDGVNLVCAGTGGTFGGIFFVLASTNLALPTSQWQKIATNYFDGTGNFIFSNALDASAPQNFYLLQLP